MNIEKLKKPSEGNFYRLAIGILLVISSAPIVIQSTQAYIDFRLNF